MFHTHAYQWDSLSGADIYYIKNIMDAMSAKIKFLYFPIVYPGKYIKVYKALKNSVPFIMSDEKIQFV